MEPIWEWNTSELKEWGLREVELAVKYAIKHHKIPAVRANHIGGRPFVFTEQDILKSEYAPLLRALPLLKEKKREAMKGLPETSSPALHYAGLPPEDSPATSLAQWQQEAVRALEQLAQWDVTLPLTTPTEWQSLIRQQATVIVKLTQILTAHLLTLDPKHAEAYWTLWQNFYQRMTPLV